MSIYHLCSTHVATLKRPLHTQDNAGGVLKSFQTVYPMSDIPCTIQPVSAKEREAFAQANIMMSHRLYSATDFGAQNGDYVFINNQSTPGYHIVGMYDEAGRGQLFRLDLLEMHL